MRQVRSVHENGTSTDRGENWRERAACRGIENPDRLFFADINNRPAVREAKAVCAGCPVRAECLEFSLRNAEYGIYGGLHERERDNVKRAPKRNALLRALAARRAAS